MIIHEYHFIAACLKLGINRNIIPVMGKKTFTRDFNSEMIDNLFSINNH